MGHRRTSSEVRAPRTYLRAHLAEKAWKYHHEMEAPPSASAVFNGTSAETTSVIMAPGNVRTARMRANLAARTACLDDWERRLKEREKQLVEGEDALESLAMVYSRRSGAVLRAVRLQSVREAASWFYHGAGLLLTGMVITAVVSIAANWQNKTWQCNGWTGMASWGIMGYTVIAGTSLIARTWVEERAAGQEGREAFVFACILAFLNLSTCLCAALWAVGASSLCHASS